MAKLPDLATQERPTPRPGGGIVSYRGPSGAETVAGEAMVRTGATLERASGEIYQAWKVEEERTNTLRAEEAFTKLREKQLDLTLGPENGYVNLKGGAAIDRPLAQEWGNKFNQAAREIESGLANDDQKLKFKQRAQVSRLQYDEGILRHLSTENDNYAKAVTDKAIKTELTNVTASPASDEAMAFSLQRVDALIDKEVMRSGYTGQAAVEAAALAKSAVRDQMWTARVEALLYKQPMMADALFRANEKQITNPQVRLLLQAKTREVATGVSAGIEAQRVVDEVRQSIPPAGAPAPRSRATPEGGPAQGSGTFDAVVGSLLKREGGYNPSDGKSGAPVNFGINQRANPDIDVKNLTKERAVELYRERYWNKIGGDNLAPATALVALDTAALQGPEVAKALIAETGGDPNAMIARRREQLRALAARDPGQAPYLSTWLRRMDGLQAEVAQMPESALRKVSATDEVLAPATNGLPNSRDIAAQLPKMMLRVETRANELYGLDQGNPDRAAFIRRMTTEIHSKVAADVQQLNAIQRQAQGVLIDAVTGTSGPAPAAGGMVAVGGTGGRAGMPGTMITSFSQIQADPKLMQAWQMMDPQAKLGIERLMEHNQRAGADTKGDVVLFRELFNRIHLEPGNPQKIDFYRQIIDPAVADRLSIQQIGQLRLEIDRAETPGGRSVNQMRKAADAQVAQWFKTHNMFIAQPHRQLAATNRWNEDVGKKTDEYVKAGKDVRSLFMLDTPDSVVSAKYLQTYVNTTPAQGLASAAAGARGAPPPVAPVAQPAAIDTRAKLDAWFQTLPPEATTFTGTDGKVRLIPGRGAGQPAVAPTSAAPTMDAQGKLVPPAPVLVQPVLEPKMPKLVGTSKDKAKIGDDPATWSDVGSAVATGAEAGAKVVAAVATAPAKAVVGGVIGAVETLTPPSDTEKAAGAFREFLTTGQFTPASAPTIQQAIDSGLLSAGELKIARRMLKAIEAKK